MSINFYKRKEQFANTRKSISEDEWYNYLETCYPDWWKSVYSDKWRINIIYYSNTCESEKYPFYVKKGYTMYQIMKMFYNYLLSQKSAITMCFGMDISNNIIKYLPENDFCPEDNYIYVHKRIFNIDGSINFKRYYVEKNKKLIHLCGDLCQQDTNNINLRIRKNSKKLTSRDFSKVHCY